ncbi:MAG: macro domain-containing protein [Lachnospiraceae bacterium]|nr:macro domain-containing protein [Lachnospiraceae bacterium]
MDKLVILHGNIVDDDILKLGDAIVLPTNPMMRCGAGVSGAIFKKAGVDKLEQYTEKAFGISYYDITRKNEMKPTEVRVTPGFALPCDIIFAQGPKAYEYDDFKDALILLLQTYQNVLRTAIARGYKSILLPALGTGSYGFTHVDTAQSVIHLLKTLLQGNDLAVYFVVYEEETKYIYRQYLYA